MVSSQEKKENGSVMNTIKFEQPFCDIDVSNKPITDIEYTKIIIDLRSRANRDLKFSDTKVEMTALEIFEIQRYQLRSGVEIGFIKGFNDGCRYGAIVGAIFSSAISVAVTVLIYRLFSN